MCSSDLALNLLNKQINEVAEENGFIEYSWKSTGGSSKGDNFVGVIQRITIEGTFEDGSCRSLHLVCKTAPRDDHLRLVLKIEILFRKELFCYTKLLPALEELQKSLSLEGTETFKYPEFYKGCLRTKEESLILRDVSLEGYQMYDKKVSLTAQQMQFIIRKLALLHAMSFALKSRDSQAFETLAAGCAESYFKIDDDLRNYQLHFKGQLERAIGVIDDAGHIEKLQRALDGNATMKISKMSCLQPNYPYSVICHGDCWTNNFMFKSNNKDELDDVLFLDWQMVRCSSPLSDLYYLMFTSTDETLRETRFDDFFELYRDNLRHYLSKFNLDMETTYPTSQFTKDKVEFGLFGLYHAFVALPFFTADHPVDISAVILNKENQSQDRYASSKTDLYATRIKGIVKDCVEHELI